MATAAAFHLLLLPNCSSSRCIQTPIPSSLTISRTPIKANLSPLICSPLSTSVVEENAVPPSSKGASIQAKASVEDAENLPQRYGAIIQSWHGAFNWAESDASQIRDVRVRVLSDMAWVTMKAYDDMEEAGPFHVTNVYEFHKGQWYMVHHHSSLDERLDQ